MLEIAVSFFFGVKVNFDAVWTYVVSLTFGNVNGQMAMQPLSTMKSAFRMQYNLNHTFTRFIRAERSDSEFYKENVPISASFSLQKSPGAAHRSRIRPFCSESPKSELLHNFNGYFPGRFWTRYNVQAVILAVFNLLLPNFDSASFSMSSCQNWQQ